MTENGLGRGFQRPFAVYVFLRTGLRLLSSAVEPESPQATEEVVQVGNCTQTVSRAGERSSHSCFCCLHLQ